MADSKAKSPAQTFTKAQLVAAKRFESDKDLVSALLEDEKQYALTEVEAMIENYKKGKVV